MAESGEAASVDVAEKLVEMAKGVSSLHATASEARDLKLARCYKFRNQKDLLARWPERLELKDEGDDVYSYQGRMIVTQDLVFRVLDAEYNELPAAMGMNKLAKMMASRFIGISNTQVRRYLEVNEQHAQWRQRRRSQRVHAVIATKPGSVLQADLTDLKRGGAAYLAVNLRKATAALNNSVNSAHGFRPVDLAVNDLPERVRKLVVQRLRQASSGTDPNAKASTVS
ncbi:hypothetical protein JKP88DRAFT_277060 [Tribonema minus]|uniref:Uncharacterized protein n=1 Tax=Tribonema minus TaxID=303371 RepID=A0A836CBH0_9STRA|nr:hypothetical protein JKP88DRAFT_291112 [Tribonema minus]KAG5184684.1 hypothetical protein JKP88DRAFT_277060 [Tribonema minus]